MHRKYFSTILSVTLLGLLLILATFFKESSFKEPAQPPPDPAPNPFSRHVSGVGIVEPQSGNIYISNPFDRMVKRVAVSVNDQIKKGDLLFQLDHRDLIANLRVKEREYQIALAKLQQLEALPRKEDLSIAQEAVKKAQTEWNESKTEYEMSSDLPNPRAMSKAEQNKRLYRFQMAEAVLREAQAQLEKIQSGAWHPELKVAQQEVEQAQAGIDAVKTEIQRMYVKSPIDGTVLQVKIRPGEIASRDPYNTAMILGNMDELYLRVSINQFDAPFINPDVPAVAFRQGERKTEYPLEFVRVEPYMVPKKYLTNAVAEKVDTQVLEILYRIKKNDPPLFIGEQMDVFIDAKKN